MKLPILKKINKEDLQTGEELPGWVDRVLLPLNQFIEQVGIAVTGRLSFGDNMAGKFLEQDFVHNVPLEVNTNDARPVVGMMPVFCNADIIVGHRFRPLSSGNIELTLLFDSASTDRRACRVLILFR